MHILSNASSLFFATGYTFPTVAVFNAVDAATGAPSMPATGAPQTGEGNQNSLDSLKTPVEDIQGHISTLQQMGATSDADQQQGALESKIQEFKKSLDALNESCQSMIIKYRQEGVPNLDAQAQAQAPQGGAPAPGMDAGMGAGMDLGLGGDPGMGGDMGAMPPAAPAPMPGGGAAPMPPAGASAPGMTTYDDLMQQNQQGVTGQGGSTMPQM